LIREKAGSAGRRIGDAYGNARFQDQRSAFANCFSILPLLTQSLVFGLDGMLSLGTEYDVRTLLSRATLLPESGGVGLAFRLMVNAVSRIVSVRIGTLHTTYSSFPFPVAVRVAVMACPTASVCTTRKPAPTSAIAAPRAASPAPLDEWKFIGAGATTVMGLFAQLAKHVSKILATARCIFGASDLRGFTAFASHAPCDQSGTAFRQFVLGHRLSSDPFIIDGGDLPAQLRFEIAPEVWCSSHTLNSRRRQSRRRQTIRFATCSTLRVSRYPSRSSCS
jgi:hypothetical protein